MGKKVGEERDARFGQIKVEANGEKGKKIRRCKNWIDKSSS